MVLGPLRFHVREEAYTMCRVPDAAGALRHARGDVLTWLLRDDDGWSAVLPETDAPGDVERVGPWRAISLRGPFAFSETGVLAAVLAPLASAGVPILAVSGFDTDHVLVPGERLDEAVRALDEAGHVRTHDVAPA